MRRECGYSHARSCYFSMLRWYDFVFPTMLVGAMWLMLMPWTPLVPVRGIDASWQRTLYYAFDSRLQFGPEILFTYGPLAFVETAGYSPGSYPWVLAIRGLVLLLLAVFYYKLFRPLPIVYGVSAALMILFAQRFAGETIYGSVPVLEAIILSQDDVGGVEAVGLAVLCGAVSLIKFSFFTMIVLVFLIMAGCRFLRWREFPLVPILYAFAVIGWFLIAGQHLSSIWEYLVGSMSVAAGYSEAMQTYGPLPEEILFCLLAASLLLVAGVHDLRRRGMWAWFPIAALMLIVFMTYKEGFVRHDGGHVGLAFAWLVVTAALYGAAISPRRFGAAGAALMVLATIPFFVGYVPIRWAVRDGINNFRSASGLLRHGAGPLNVEFEAAQAALRRALPLPEVKGSVDIYPVEQSTLLATDMDFHPRPVFQSYAAYTNYLTNRNVDSLKQGTAPQTIFFDVWTIDGRVPALDDGASWPELLTRYDVISIGPNFVRLNRRSMPRTYKLAPLLKTSIGLGDVLPIKNSDSLIWAHIQLKKTIFGSLLNTLIKAPIVNLEVTLHDGGVRQFRIVPGEAEAGFLLSPLVENRLGFVALEQPGVGGYLMQQRVEKIRILPERLVRFAYQREFQIMLETLTLSGSVPAASGDFGPGSGN